MTVTWVIQTNMGSQSDIQTYVDSVRNTGADVIEVEYIPFSNVLPDLTIDGPVVFYGAVDFIRAVSNSGKWSLGVFGDINTFTYENWAKHYNELLLNSPDGVELMAIGEFSIDGRNPEDDIFVRPQHDTKSLVGSVMTVGEFYKWAVEAKTGVFANVDHDTPIMIANPYGIQAEWRLFVADDIIVASTQYYKRGRLHKEPGAPAGVINFAKDVIKRWSPAPVYVLDIGMSAENYYIIEAQGFNSAGTYAANIENIAAAVNIAAVRLFNLQKSV